MSDTEVLSTRPLQWCSRKMFWGSHGCTLGDHDGDTHECAVIDKGQLVQCSQARIVDEKWADVRFWNWQENAWGEWSRWEWSQ